MPVVRKENDGNFYPFGRDAPDDASLNEAWPYSYEHIEVSLWCGYSDNIEIVVSDMPGEITVTTNIISLLEENFTDSDGAGPVVEKRALEELRDCITKLIDIRKKELEDHPYLGEDQCVPGSKLPTLASPPQAEPSEPCLDAIFSRLKS